VVLDDMLCRGCAPNVVAYNILLEVACSARGYREAMELPDFIDAICRGDLDDTRKFLDSHPSKGFKSNTVNYKSILKVFCGVERWDDADEIVTEMIQENCQ
jgi:pentatricopeptide repeat protein